VEHPKRPRSHPSVSFLRRNRQDFFLDESAEHRAVVSFVDASHSDGQLHVFELVEAYVDGVLKVVGQEEEGGSVFLI
jgi:hypothetical protein